MLAETEISRGLGQKALLEPDLVLRQRAARTRDAGAQAFLLSGGKSRNLLCALAVEHGDEAGVLLARGFGMNLWNAGRDQHLAHLPEEARQFVEPLAEILHALRSRCEFPREQRVHRVAGEPCIYEWIPAPLLEGLDSPAFVFELLPQQDGVHLVGARQRGAIQPIEGGEVALIEGNTRLPAGGADVVDTVVEAMISESRRIHRRQLLRFAQIALPQRLEILVRGRRWRRRGWWWCGRRWSRRARAQQQDRHTGNDTPVHRMPSRKSQLANRCNETLPVKVRIPKQLDGPHRLI